MKQKYTSYNPLSLVTRIGILALVMMTLCKCTYQSISYTGKKETHRDVTALSLFGMGETNELSKNTDQGK